MYYYWRTTRKLGTSAFSFAVGMVGMFTVISLIFLISTNLVSMPGTTVKLPAVAGAHYLTGEKLIVTVTADGKLFYNAEEVSWNDFRVKLDNWVSERAGRGEGGNAEEYDFSRPKIIVCADENVRMADWLKLAENARALGLDFILASAPPPGSSVSLPQSDVSVIGE